MKIFIALLFFSTLLLSISSNSQSLESADIIKLKLQAELKSSYLKKFETKFGDCGTHPESCLSLKNQGTDNSYIMANFPNKEFCYPYTMCGFYHCMENTFHCKDVGVNYFTDLAFPTCSAYEKNINANKFTEKGVEWIYSVMVCLQKGLTDECILNGNCNPSLEQKQQKITCNHITEFTLLYHPGCYINSGIGVCHLPLQDKLEIWKTVNPFMTKREREEAYKVIFTCIKEYP